MTVKGLTGFKRSVKELAKGRYYTIQHKITEYKDGKISHSWGAYIEDIGWTFDHPTPEEALEELRGMINEAE